MSRSRLLVANVVPELAEGKDVIFSDRGETSLREFDDPVRLFEVRWGAEAVRAVALTLGPAYN